MLPPGDRLALSHARTAPLPAAPSGIHVSVSLTRDPQGSRVAASLIPKTPWGGPPVSQPLPRKHGYVLCCSLWELLQVGQWPQEAACPGQGLAWELRVGHVALGGPGGSFWLLSFFTLTLDFPFCNVFLNEASEARALGWGSRESSGAQGWKGGQGHLVHPTLSRKLRPREQQVLAGRSLTLGEQCQPHRWSPCVLPIAHHGHQGPIPPAVCLSMARILGRSQGGGCLEITLPELTSVPTCSAAQAG